MYAIAGGEEKTVKVATAAGKPEKVTLSVIVEGDTDLSEMTFGMKTENTTANWVFLDDVTVQYFGSDAMFMAVEAAKDEANKAADKVGGYSCMTDYQDAVCYLQEQIDNLDATATTQDEVDHLLDQLRSAVADADENVALYEKLTSLGDELTLLTTNADGKYDAKDLQAAYDDCGTGETYDDLCGSYSLNNADLKAYIEKLQTLMVSIASLLSRRVRTARRTCSPILHSRVLLVGTIQAQPSIRPIRMLSLIRVPSISIRI